MGCLLLHSHMQTGHAFRSNKGTYAAGAKEGTISKWHFHCCIFFPRACCSDMCTQALQVKDYSGTRYAFEVRQATGSVPTEVTQSRQEKCSSNVILEMPMTNVIGCRRQQTLLLHLETSYALDGKSCKDKSGVCCHHRKSAKYLTEMCTSYHSQQTAARCLGDSWE